MTHDSDFPAFDPNTHPMDLTLCVKGRDNKKIAIIFASRGPGDPERIMIMPDSVIVPFTKSNVARPLKIGVSGTL